MNHAIPTLTVLSNHQIEQIHQHSLEILANIGVRVDSERARKVFEKAEGIKASGSKVFIPKELVEWAIEAAPASVKIYDRRGNSAMLLNNERTYFGIGVTNLWYEEPASGEIVTFTRKHLGDATRLGHALSEFDVVSTPGVAQDVQPDKSDLYGTLEMIANTTKPLVLLVSDSGQFGNSLDLLQYLHSRDLADRPFVIPYFNPITPLVMNAETTDKIFTTIDRGLPFIYSNYGMAGSSTPITPMGALVTLNAELLAGLVFSQLVKQGTPIILGSLPAMQDMKTMGSIYTPQTMLLNLACAEMMSHYSIPHCGTSGSGPGWGPDLISSSALWMNHLTSCLGKVGLVPFVGGNFDSLVFSPATIVYANEIIRQSRIFARGFSLENATDILDEIKAVCPGGDFLMADSTLQHFREMMDQQSRIWPNYSLEAWQNAGRPEPLKKLREKTLEIFDKVDRIEDHNELLIKGEAFLNQF